MKSFGAWRVIMRDLEILRQMIKDGAQVSLAREYDTYTLVLHEPQTTDCTVKIRGLSPDVLVIKGDAFKAPDDLFKGSHGECRRADFIVISTHENRKKIVHIELKKTKAPWEEIVQQLQGSHCLLLYCREIGTAFWKDRDFLKGYQERYISIGHVRIAKRRTRIEQPSGKHDKPGKALKIDWPNTLHFNHISS